VGDTFDHHEADSAVVDQLQQILVESTSSRAAWLARNSSVATGTSFTESESMGQQLYLMLDLDENGEVVRVEEYISGIFQRREQIQSFAVPIVRRECLLSTDERSHGGVTDAIRERRMRLYRLPGSRNLNEAAGGPPAGRPLSRPRCPGSSACRR
jgi:hypothetical protein